MFLDLEVLLRRGAPQVAFSTLKKEERKKKHERGNEIHQPLVSQFHDHVDKSNKHGSFHASEEYGSFLFPLVSNIPHTFSSLLLSPVGFWESLFYLLLGFGKPVWNKKMSLVLILGM